MIQVKKVILIYKDNSFPEQEILIAVFYRFFNAKSLSVAISNNKLNLKSNILLFV